MKKEIHPEYRPVIFKDTSSSLEFLTHSTLTSKETGKWKDGKEYPVFKMEISSASHPFYTGSDKIIDAEGRVEKFQKKFKLRSSISSTREDSKANKASEVSKAKPSEVSKAKPSEVSKAKPSEVSKAKPSEPSKASKSSETSKPSEVSKAKPSKASETNEASKPSE